MKFILQGDYKLKYNGTTYKPGDEVEMTEKAAAAAGLYPGRLEKATEVETAPPAKSKKEGGDK